MTNNTTNNTIIDSSFHLWHSRLGHASMDTIKKVLNLCNIFYRRNTLNKFCAICVQAKSHHLSFSTCNTIYSHPLELVYINIWDLAPVTFINGAKYYVDAYSKFTYLYLLLSKSQILYFSKLMLRIKLITKLNLFKLTMLKNFLLLLLILIRMVFFIDSLIHINMNKMTPLNVSINIINTRLSLLVGATLPKKVLG